MKNGRPFRVCLLGASLSTGNRGVSALAAGTVSAVRNAYPDAEVFLLEYGKEPARYTVYSQPGPVTVELVNLRFSWKCYLPNNIARLLCEAFLIGLLPVSRWKDFLLRKSVYFRRILEADVVASIAGGDSFSDIYGLSRLWYMALPQILVLWLGKPLILLPQTLGPFQGIWARAIARYILRRAQAAYSRDHTSFAEAGRLMGTQSDKLRFSYDMAFVLEAVRPPEAKLRDLPAAQGGAPWVGINVSGLLLMGGYTRNNMFGLKTNYARLVREMVDYFIRKQGANVILVPHVFGDDAESDTRAGAEMFRELQLGREGRLFLLSGDFDQHEIKYVIGRCDFFIGARMHACIAALSQAVPAIGLAYSRKFIGVMESIECGELTADLRELDNDGVMETVRRIFASRGRIHHCLQSRMPDVRAKVLELFSRSNSGAAE